MVAVTPMETPREGCISPSVYMEGLASPCLRSPTTDLPGLVVAYPAWFRSLFDFWVIVITAAFAAATLGSYNIAIFPRVDGNSKAECLIVTITGSMYVFGQTVLLMYRTLLLSNTKEYFKYMGSLLPMFVCMFATFIDMAGHQNSDFEGDRCLTKSPFMVFFFIMFVSFTVSAAVFAHRKVGLNSREARPLKLFLFSTGLTIVGFIGTSVAMQVTTIVQSQRIALAFLVVDWAVFLYSANFILVRLQCLALPRAQRVRLRVPLSRLSVLALAAVFFLAAFLFETVSIVFSAQEANPLHARPWDVAAIHTNWLIFSLLQLATLAEACIQHWPSQTQRTYFMVRLAFLCPAMALFTASIAQTIEGRNNDDLATALWPSHLWGFLRIVPLLLVLPFVMYVSRNSTERCSDRHTIRWLVSWLCVSAGIYIFCSATYSRSGFLGWYRWCFLGAMCALMWFTLLVLQRVLTAPPKMVHKHHRTRIERKATKRSIPSSTRAGSHGTPSQSMQKTPHPFMVTPSITQNHVLSNAPTNTPTVTPSLNCRTLPYNGCRIPS